MSQHPTDPGPPRAEELAAEAEADNPDPTTRRETLELGLMEEERSDEGADVQIDEQS